jgi:hypothetical protein
MQRCTGTRSEAVNAPQAVCHAACFGKGWYGDGFGRNPTQPQTFCTSTNNSNPIVQKRPNSLGLTLFLRGNGVFLTKSEPFAGKS